MMEPRKILFQEAWSTTTVFLMDDELEADIEQELHRLLKVPQYPYSSNGVMDVSKLACYLRDNKMGLDVLLKDIGMPKERFQRIITLLRKLGHIPGEMDREWSIAGVKSRIARDCELAHLIADLLANGSRDPELAKHVPKDYLDMLDCNDLSESAQATKRIRYKRLLIGTRGGKLGYAVERRIRDKLERLAARYGVGYGSGQWQVVDTNIDLAIPGIEDPWVLIMSSYQETTSSGQTNKARDMQRIYERVRQFNSRNRENRAFVNFVDGGGWLARPRDFERLVNECHYFINFHYLDMLEDIVLKHVPKEYFNVGR